MLISSIFMLILRIKFFPFEILKKNMQFSETASTPSNRRTPSWTRKIRIWERSENWNSWKINKKSLNCFNFYHHFHQKDFKKKYENFKIWKIKEFEAFKKKVADERTKTKKDKEKDTETIRCLIYFKKKTYTESFWNKILKIKNYKK